MSHESKWEKALAHHPRTLNTPTHLTRSMSERCCCCRRPDTFTLFFYVILVSNTCGHVVLRWTRVWWRGSPFLAVSSWLTWSWARHNCRCRPADGPRLQSVIFGNKRRREKGVCLDIHGGGGGDNDPDNQGVEGALRSGRRAWNEYAFWWCILHRNIFKGIISSCISIGYFTSYRFSNLFVDFAQPKRHEHKNHHQVNCIDNEST